MACLIWSCCTSSCPCRHVAWHPTNSLHPCMLPRHNDGSRGSTGSFNPEIIFSASSHFSVVFREYHYLLLENMYCMFSRFYQFCQLNLSCKTRDLNVLCNFQISSSVSRGKSGNDTNNFKPWKTPLLIVPKVVSRMVAGLSIQVKWNIALNGELHKDIRMLRIYNNCFRKSVLHLYCLSWILVKRNV